MSKDEPKGSFVRWQGTTIAQLTYAINLILTLSVATLGFQVATLQMGNFTPGGCWEKCSFALSLLFLAASVAFGVLVVVNRLLSFRTTTRVARKREKMRSEQVDEAQIDLKLEPLRARYRTLDQRTWCLFCCQIGAYAGGVFFTIVAVLAHVGNKLL